MKNFLFIIILTITFAIPAYLAKCAADAGMQNDMAITNHSHDDHADHSEDSKDADEENSSDSDEVSDEAYAEEEQISEEEPLSEESETGYVQE